jgi:hypothetical protein
MKTRPNKKFAFFGYRVPAKKGMNVAFCMSMTKINCPFVDTFKKMAIVKKEMSVFTSMRDLLKIQVLLHQIWQIQDMNHVLITNVVFVQKGLNADNFSSISYKTILKFSLRIRKCQVQVGSYAKITLQGFARLVPNANTSI